MSETESKTEKRKLGGRGKRLASKTIDHVAALVLGGVSIILSPECAWFRGVA